MCQSIFCLEPTVRKDTWKRTISVTVTVKYRSEGYLITAMFKFLSQQLRYTLTTAFERNFTVEDFTEMDLHACKSIMDQHTRKIYFPQNSFLAKHEKKIDEGVWKIISFTKIQACNSKKIEDDISLFYCMLLFLS